jgi:1-acyl-sn-glycerol-3-phosphate acyltransferase
MNALFKTIRVAWLFLWASIATLILCIPVILAALLSRTGNLAFSLSKIWAYIMLAVSFVRAEIKNKAKILKGQSYIIISNHQSLYDILALVTTLGIQFRWFAKKEVLKIPLFGYALYASRNIFIDRSNTARAIESINKGLNRLPKDAGVMVFAEGTRSSDGQIHEFKKGGFIIAIMRKIPILPVTVNGSRRILPKGDLVVKPGKIQVVVGDPIDTSGYTTDTVQELIDKTRRTIMANFDPEYEGRAEETGRCP